MSINRGGLGRGRVGVAISTTGDEHRLRFLETCVANWQRALRHGDSLFVTVDGSVADAARVQGLLRHHTRVMVFRVGQPVLDRVNHETRQGVATNKNTGLELLMDATEAEHLFLSDDDTWPVLPQALGKHIDLSDKGAPHSMVCWGKSRLLPENVGKGLAAWKWPRGVLLYAHRTVVEAVGGMDERFGPGGHEHVEWSNRIHNHGFTPAPFVTPASYALASTHGTAHRASMLWHCEDMPRAGEPIAEVGRRRAALTSIDHAERDWDQIHKIMALHEGDAGYVPFRAHQNSRSSATLSAHLTCAMEPAEPRSKK